MKKTAVKTFENNLNDSVYVCNIWIIFKEKNVMSKVVEGSVQQAVKLALCYVTTARMEQKWCDGVN